MKETFDSTMQAEHATAIAVAFAFTGVLIFLTVVWLLFRKKIKLSVLIGVCLWTTVLTVGVVAWTVTYAAMRDTIEEEVEALLIARGEEASQTVVHRLNIAPVLTMLQQRLSAAGIAHLNATFPAPVQFQSALLTVHTEAYGEGLFMLYYGNRHGWLFGVVNSESGTPEDPEHTVFVAVPEDAPAPPELSCVGWDNPEAACAEYEPRCGSNATHDDLCTETCNIADNAFCTGLQGTTGGMGKLLMYKTKRGEHLPMPGTVTSNAGKYDPRLRVWYEYTEACAWSAPYPFHPHVGFTATIGVRNPGTGEWEGVVAVDFTLSSLSHLFVTLPPTKNAAVTLVTLNGEILSSHVNDTSVLLRLDETLSFAQHKIVHYNDSIPAIREKFQIIISRFGNLHEAAKRVSILHEDQQAILVKPLQIACGMELLLVILLPYTDVLQNSYTASTEALGIVIGMSAGAAILVVILIMVSLHPLGILAATMHRLAWMKVEESLTFTTITEEVSWMSDSFALIQGNLREYKQFLPQSLVVCDSDSSNAVEPSEGGTEEGTSTGSLPKEQATSGSRSRKSTDSPASAQRVLHKFGMELAEKPISLLFLNMTGSHRMLARGNSFFDAYSTYLQGILQETRAVKGVIDTFTGDRVLIAFNAITRVPNHRARVAHTALKVFLNLKPSGLECTAAACAGRARCGNAGCPGLKKFSIWGGIVEAACLMERCCSQFGINFIVDFEISAACKGFFEMKYLYQVHMPHTAKPALLVAILAARNKGLEEWMFSTTEDAKEESRTSPYNEVVLQLISGDITKATELLALCSTEDAPLLQQRITEATRLGAEAPLIRAPPLKCQVCRACCAHTASQYPRVANRVSQLDWSCDKRVSAQASAFCATRSPTLLIPLV